MGLFSRTVWRVLLEGKDVRRRVGEEEQLVGFRVTRFIVCKNRDDALQKALEKVLEELKELSENGPDDPPKMFWREVEKFPLVGDLPDPESPFAWYLMSEGYQGCNDC